MSTIKGSKGEKGRGRDFGLVVSCGVRDRGVFSFWSSNVNLY